MPDWVVTLVVVPAGEWIEMVAFLRRKSRYSLGR